MQVTPKRHSMPSNDNKFNRKKRVFFVISLIVLFSLLIAIVCEIAALLAFYDSLVIRGSLFGKYLSFGGLRVLMYGVIFRFSGFVFFLIAFFFGFALLPTFFQKASGLSAIRLRMASLVLLVMFSMYFFYVAAHVFTLQGIRGTWPVYCTWLPPLPDLGPVYECPCPAMIDCPENEDAETESGLKSQEKHETDAKSE